MLVLIFLVLTALASCDDQDFYDGLREDVSAKAQFGTTRHAIVLSGTEDAIFFDRVTKSQDQAASESIEIERRRIEALDNALALPPKLQETYRQEQKRLQNLQKAYAKRIVEGSILRQGFREQMQRQQSIAAESAQTGSVQSLANENSEQGNLNQVAASLLPKVPASRRESFVSGWEAAQIEPRARQTFALALVANSLYGVSSAQAQIFDTQLSRIAEEYKNSQATSAQPKWTDKERDQFLYLAVRNHKGLLNLSTRRNLERIAELEIQASSATSRTDLQLATKKLEWEKAFLIKNLERDGLKLDEIQLADVQITDKAFLNWYQAKHKAGKTMLWPLKEAGKILRGYDPDHPTLLLQAVATDMIVSVCDGTLKVMDRQLQFDCAAAQVLITGDFVVLPKVSGKVKAGQAIANLPSSTAEIEISAYVDGRSLDFQSFF